MVLFPAPAGPSIATRIGFVISKPFTGGPAAYNGVQGMDPREFDKLVDQAIEAIPSRFRKRLHNVAFVVEREPPSPNLLGLYQGRPLTVRSVGDSFAMPDRITIYQGPHERMARDRVHLLKLLEDTVWHEVATTSEWMRSVSAGRNAEGPYARGGPCSALRSTPKSCGAGHQVL